MELSSCEIPFTLTFNPLFIVAQVPPVNVVEPLVLTV